MERLTEKNKKLNEIISKFKKSPAAEDEFQLKLFRKSRRKIVRLIIYLRFINNFDYCKEYFADCSYLDYFNNYILKIKSEYEKILNKECSWHYNQLLLVDIFRAIKNYDDYEKIELKIEIIIQAITLGSYLIPQFDMDYKWISHLLFLLKNNLLSINYFKMLLSGYLEQVSNFFKGISFMEFSKQYFTERYENALEEIASKLFLELPNKETVNIIKDSVGTPLYRIQYFFVLREIEKRIVIKSSKNYELYYYKNNNGNLMPIQHRKINRYSKYMTHRTHGYMINNFIKGIAIQKKEKYYSNLYLSPLKIEDAEKFCKEIITNEIYNPLNFIESLKISLLNPYAFSTISKYVDIFKSNFVIVPMNYYYSSLTTLMELYFTVDNYFSFSRSLKNINLFEFVWFKLNMPEFNLEFMKNYLQKLDEFYLTDDFSDYFYNINKHNFSKFYDHGEYKTIMNYRKEEKEKRDITLQKIKKGDWDDYYFLKENFILKFEEKLCCDEHGSSGC